MVGNVMIDTLLQHLNRARELKSLSENPGAAEGEVGARKV